MLAGIDVVENTTEWHFPGQNFTGPGTHIVSKIKNGVLPNNKTDFITMLHDISYLQHAEDGSLVDDYKAIIHSDFSLPGLVTKAGMIGKHLGLASLINYNQRLDGKTVDETKFIGDVLAAYVTTEEPYKSQFLMYDTPLSYLGNVEQSDSGGTSQNW